tara:strand:- start:475 stop:747 length:273 start_codon:yes stop_codon:yes gene_type:complete
MTKKMIKKLEKLEFQFLLQKDLGNLGKAEMLNDKVNKLKNQLNDSILQKVLLVDCSEDDAQAIITNELDKIGIFNPNIEDEIFQNWKDSQ